MLAALFAVALAAPAQAEAQKVVATLFGGAPEVSGPYEGFFEGMRALGYVEGRGVRYERRWDRRGDANLARDAAEIVALKPDVIVVSGARALEAVRRATRAIPVVVPFTSDLPATGSVEHLSRPGGNVTGLTAMSTDLGAKRIELLKEAAPRIRVVGVVWNSVPSKDRRWPETEATARSLGVALRSVEVRDPPSLEAAFVRLAGEHVDAVLVFNDRFTATRRGRITALAIKHRLPAMYDVRDYVDEGGLMSYGPNQRDMFRRAAIYVDKILKGAKPGELPVEQPTLFELVINLKTAKMLGLAIPDALLTRADAVIE